MNAPRPPFVAIGLLSACVLAYEVLLTRLFSIVLWHHFAYMIISAAMLGYGASGTALTLLKEKIIPHVGTVYVMAATGMAFLMPAAFLLTQQVPFNPLELLWDKTQLAKLLAIYLLMMLPFFCGGLGIGLVLWHFGKEAGRIYAFDILGAGVGSLGVIGVLFLVPPNKVLIVLTALALLAAAVAIIELKVRPKWLAGVLAGLTSLVAVALPGDWLQVHISPYKDLSEALNIAGAKVIEQRSSPLGQITVVENTRIPFRHAPGMSLNATEEPPPQLGVFVDGEGPSVLTRFDGNLAPLAYLDQFTSALPYHVLAQPHVRPQVLVLGAGAGSDVLQALYFHAASVDAVELDRNVIDLVRQRFHDFAGDLYAQPGVHVHEGEARGFANASREHYDLVQVALLDSFGVASAGLYGLSESYIYTVEALQTYLNRLRLGGILAITRWLTLPPRDALKLFATAALALERNGVPNPGRRLVMIRGWKTVTLLVKNSDFTASEIEAVKEFSRKRSFDVAYYPGMRADEANRYNVLVQPYFFEGAVALLGPQRQNFIDRYKFYIEPATDDRPFFFHFFKWKAAAELFALREQGGMPLLDWSYPLLVTALIQAFVVSVLLILAPLAISRCRHILPTARVALYFLAIGLAFMFIEIAFIQKFVLFLAHPLYAVAVVLCAFLVFAAVGSWLAGRWQKRAMGSGYLIVAVMVMGVLSLLYLAILPGLFQAFIHLPDMAKIAISVVLIAPLAVCMGMPFPTGMMRLAATTQDAIPWAWAINGFASVVGAVLATLLAIHLGFAMVILLAVVIYGLAAVALRGFA
ncbi:SAM-dependent methyltransferase [Nitrosospira sp. Nsp1]|uniref:spermine/spermidine synthase domain-containing protein n=1 Tax=Nitrosospira sp. Nsp1 TaxID=136547 RepID=UPI0008867C91|nr:SAM-dependent methyltransferase [Nitrosospira sp. Nsp1]SCX52307.1 Spermine/spermidine synthase [Nitrosospira sp. Nsp1]